MPNEKGGKHMLEIKVIPEEDGHSLSVKMEGHLLELMESLFMAVEHTVGTILHDCVDEEDKEGFMMAMLSGLGKACANAMMNEPPTDSKKVLAVKGGLHVVRGGRMQ